MYRHILLPTDATPGGETAVEHALDLARSMDATLDVLYVVDMRTIPLDAHSEALVAAMKSEGERAVEEIIARAHERGIDATGHIQEGRTHETIVGLAADHDVDCIVMATHGRSGVNRVLLGSVTERVLRTSGVPVLAVPLH